MVCLVILFSPKLYILLLHPGATLLFHLIFHLDLATLPPEILLLAALILIP